MVRKVAAVVFLLLLAVGALFVARWFRSRNDLRVTLLVSLSTTLRAGDPVTEGEEVIGRVRRVEKLEGRDAVVLQIPERYRQRVLTDSIFYIEENDGRSTLRLANTLAIGNPVEDDAVLKARDDRLARLLVKHGPQVEKFIGSVKDKTAALLKEYDSGRLNRELEDFKKRIPEWQREGDEVVEKKIDEVRERVEKVEEALREENRDREAQRLKERFEEWLDGLDLSKGEDGQ